MIRIHKKKLNIKYLIILFVVLTVIFLLILYLLTKDDRKLSTVEKFAKDGILIINKIALTPFNLIKDIFDHNSNIQKIEEEISKRDQVKLEALDKELKELKGLLEIDNALSEYEEINAVVNNRNIGFWYNTLTINKGSSSGIKENMAVITYSGLIGRIIKTTSYTSTVKLLTSDDANNKVSVQIKIKDKFIYGILKEYDYEKNLYTIEGITENIDIEIGSLVSTTGLGDIFPQGILIGTVESVSKDNFDLAPIVKVKPSVDFKGISYVKVLRRSVK